MDSGRVNVCSKLNTRSVSSPYSESGILLWIATPKPLVARSSTTTIDGRLIALHRWVGTLVTQYRAALSSDDRRRHQMDRETKERSLVLCEQAAVEQDPARLLALVTEINRLLEEKEQRVRHRIERISSDS
jgi:hypothetical protein